MQVRPAVGIRKQGTKISSPSSVGVLGEIMAGLYAQAGIAPWVLVRVIHRWPDFIFSTPFSDRCAFVEAKAYTSKPRGQHRVDIPDPLLGDCLVDAVQELNADPSVQVWNAFTYIEQISPLRLQVTFLELDVNPNRRTRNTHLVLPAAVITGVAERAFRRSLLKLSDLDLALLRQNPKRRTESQQRQLEQNVLSIALEELEELLIEEGPEVAVLASKQAIGEEIRQLLLTVTIDDGEGQRFFSARQQAAAGGLSHIRFIGTQSLLIGDLDRQSRNAITTSWKPNWEAANKPWRRIGELSLWRCGGAVFAVGSRQHKGIRIS